MAKSLIAMLFDHIIRGDEKRLGKAKSDQRLLKTLCDLDRMDKPAKKKAARHAA